MEKLYEVFDFYPKEWNERDKARVAIWIILAVIMVSVGFLLWGNLYYFPKEINRISIINDSLYSKMQVIAKNDSLRLIIDNERRQAMVEWRKSFERDEIRKKNWDQRFKRDNIKN
jgi:hypothetical protein